MIKTWTVYIHITPSNKYYVGITSLSLKTRWKNGKAYQRCSYFRKAIEKYGWSNIQHEVVASGLTEQEAKNFEVVLIKKLNSNDSKLGYNKTLGGEGVKGLKHTEEQKRKQSEFMKTNNPSFYKPHKEQSCYGRTGNKHPMYGIPRHLHPSSRKVECLTTGEIFECVKSGAEKYNTYGSDINKCCTGRLKSAGKLQDGTKLTWRYI